MDLFPFVAGGAIVLIGVAAVIRQRQKRKRKWRRKWGSPWGRPAA